MKTLSFIMVLVVTVASVSSRFILISANFPDSMKSFLDLRKLKSSLKLKRKKNSFVMFVAGYREQINKS
jgi:hypothetical protein